MGTVKVNKGRYIPEGEFHQIEAGTPIRNENGKLAGVTKPRNMTYMHSYGGEANFFEGVSDKGRLMGTRCDNADCPGHGTIWVPYHIHCPDCLGKNTIIDVTALANETATIYTYIVTERSGAFNTLEKPIRFVDIEFAGTAVATLFKGYMVGPGQPTMGTRIRPVFRTVNPTYTIQDIAWVLMDTTEDQLPEGFSFAK
jgi:uncharacterized protein